MVRRLGASLVAATMIAGSTAHADGDIVLSERWHEVPAGGQLRLSEQIVDELAELGNFIGAHVNLLSDDFLGMKFDGRRRRARFRIGTGEGEMLRFRLDSDWHFAGSKARIQARLSLGIGGHDWHLELPDMEMVPTSYHGERGVELRLPLFERHW